MRVSLYKHELDAVVQLTETLTRMACGEQDGYISDIGPKIFEKLMDVMYARGNYEIFAGNSATLESPDSTEVR